MPETTLGIDKYFPSYKSGELAGALSIKLTDAEAALTDTVMDLLP